MNQTDMRKKENMQRSWEDGPSREEPQLASWQDSAFHAALEKLHTEHGNLDSVMRTGEAFGRGLYAQRIKDKPDWTIKEWLKEIEQDVCKPLGTEFTFTKISHDVVTTFMNRNPLVQASQERSAESLFNFGVMRGLFLSAFPQGELVMNKIKNKDHPELIFKTYASAKDKLERERLIRTFTFLKKEDGA